MDADEAMLLMERVMRAKEIVNLDEETFCRHRTTYPWGLRDGARDHDNNPPALRTPLAGQPPPNMPFFLSPLSSQPC